MRRIFGIDLMLDRIDQEVLQSVKTNEPAGDAVPIEQMFHDPELAGATQIFLTLATDEGRSRSPDVARGAEGALAMDMEVTRCDELHIRPVQQIKQTATGLRGNRPIAAWPFCAILDE